MVPAIGAIVTILGESVADDHQDFQSCTARFEFCRGVPYSGPHACGAFWFHGGNSVKCSRVERPSEFFRYIEFNAVVAITRKTIHAILVTESLHGTGHQHHSFPLDIDDSTFCVFCFTPTLQIEVEFVIIVWVGIAEIKPGPRIRIIHRWRVGRRLIDRIVGGG